MADNSKSNGWSEYRPSKAVWFWSCVGCVVATIAVGFTWGGWVTSGAAANRAEGARAELAATVCVARFISAPDARAQLAALQAESRWRRDDLILDGGWATPPGLGEPIGGTADLCAAQLATMELPPEAVVDEASAAGQEDVAPEVEAN